MWFRPRPRSKYSGPGGTGERRELVPNGMHEQGGEQRNWRAASSNGVYRVPCGTIGFSTDVTPIEPADPADAVTQDVGNRKKVSLMVLKFAESDLAADLSSSECGFQMVVSCPLSFRLGRPAAGVGSGSRAAAPRRAGPSASVSSRARARRRPDRSHGLRARPPLRRCSRYRD